MKINLFAAPLGGLIIKRYITNSSEPAHFLCTTTRDNKTTIKKNEENDGNKSAETTEMSKTSEAQQITKISEIKGVIIIESAYWALFGLTVVLDPQRSG